MKTGSVSIRNKKENGDKKTAKKADIAVSRSHKILEYNYFLMCLPGLLWIFFFLHRPDERDYPCVRRL